MTPSDTKSTVLLKHHLKALKLPTVLAECEKVAQRAAAENLDHLGFLLQVCELELIERERRAAERRLKAARFPAAKTLGGFDFAARPGLNKPRLPGRVRVRAGEQGRGRVAVRRDRHRLRALECAADDQPAVGELDRGARQRAVDRGSVRPPDTPLPHRGDDGGELSPAGCQAA